MQLTSELDILSVSLSSRLLPQMQETEVSHFKSPTRRYQTVCALQVAMDAQRTIVDVQHSLDHNIHSVKS